VSMTNPTDRVEIIASMPRRRRWTVSEKVQMVKARHDESEDAGVASDIAQSGERFQTSACALRSKTIGLPQTNFTCYPQTANSGLHPRRVRGQAECSPRAQSRGTA
jgi:hypothetical protein